LFATVIATYGILSNSTATVIGAMLVAPLMGPMMATTAAVVMGSFPRALHALALTAAGIVSVIVFSYLLSWVVPDVTISFTSNAEITSRIHPGLYALLTALGAGAADAFITSRAELVEALGGVAIAIVLVPPLCVVGIALKLGQLDAAAGASLLFLTNFLAKATVEVQKWLADTSYRIDTVNASGGVVEVTVEGTGPLKPVEQLANQLAVALDHSVIVELRVLPVKRVTSSNP
jgi:uncharacterized hydrophobic protein (TIGR00271 family)